MIVDKIIAVVVDGKVVACSLDGVSFWAMQNGVIGSLKYYVGLEGQEIVELDLNRVLLGEGGLVKELVREAC